jgi:hypothetical protein
VIRNIDPALKRIIGKFAKQSGRSISTEAKLLICRGVSVDDRVGFGTRLFYLVDEDVRGDDLVFEYKGPPEPPPDFD